MPNCKNQQQEKLRRIKISQTLKRKWNAGEIKSWNKGMKMPEDYCKKLSDYWKTHTKRGRFFKGMKCWNKGLEGYQSGEKHYNWKGGISRENNKLHGSAEYKNWRKSVFQRDNFTCQVCCKRGIYLMAHHIKSFTYFPNIRFNIDNGITFCKSCHKIYHKIFGKTLKNPANSVNSLRDNAELTRQIAEMCRDYTRDTLLKVKT